MKGTATMNCPKCGKELDQDAAFCKYCGTKVITSNEPEGTKSVKRKTRLSTVVAFLLGAALVVVGFYLVNSVNSKHTGPPAHQRQVLINDVISVPADGTTPYNLTLTNDALLTGDFRAFGGSGNDIVVLVMDADSYVNWTNGHEVKVFYNSGQVTVGKLSVSLSQGKYYIVFDNRFSVFTSKSVEAHIDLVSR